MFTPIDKSAQVSQPVFTPTGVSLWSDGIATWDSEIASWDSKITQFSASSKSTLTGQSLINKS